VQRICVIPKPYTQPHPPIWQPFSVSEKTIRWCAAENIVPWILVSHPPSFRKLCEAYRDEAAKAGRQIARGQSVAAFRGVYLGNTTTEANNLAVAALNDGFVPYFSGFGFFEAFRFPGETTPVPMTAERMIKAKYALVGTPDDMKRELDAMRTDTNVEWFGWYFDQGLISWDDARRQLELFATKVMPEFKD
jgi:alkanesulfonate monooxygenase SsuD/methylene tetrahydromethanopterin reductase-like flavin-dependent oxidoreductase (luciferase family)